MSRMEKIWDVLTTEVPEGTLKLRYLYGACIAVLGAIIYWGLYGKYDAHFVHGFEGQEGHPRLTITSADDSTWFLNSDGGNIATLEMKSPQVGTYDFKIVNSRDPRLEVGITFSLLKTSITNDLICLDCERMTRSRLPMLWRVSK